MPHAPAHARIRARTRIRALALAGAIALTACGGSGSGFDLSTAAHGVDQVAAALAEARSLWTDDGPATYTLHYRRVCFCPQADATVTVTEGQVTSAEGSDAADPLDALALFALVEDAIAQNPDGITASFDPTTGILLRLQVDPILEAIDEEYGIEVTIVAPGPSRGPVDRPPVAVDHLDASLLTVEYGCGYGFHVGSADQRVALHVEPTDWEAAGRGDLPAPVTLPDPAWDVDVVMGTDLFANWCDDVMEPGEPTPDVQQAWSVAGGTIQAVSVPAQPCGAGAATVELTGLVVTSANGEGLDVGDLVISNDAWGCFAG